MGKKTESICKLFFIQIILIAIALSSCKHKTKFETLTEVSYKTAIAPIISSNCAFSGCHGADTLKPKFKLTSYESLISDGGIKQGHPEESKLYKTISTLNSEEIMPKKPYSELTEKQMQLIYVWIGQGAKNN